MKLCKRVDKIKALILKFDEIINQKGRQEQFLDIFKLIIEVNGKPIF